MKSNSVEVKKVDKLIYVDNLEVSFSGNILISPTSAAPDHNGNQKVLYFNPQCYIEYQPSGNKFFENIVDLWIANRRIGEFRFSPRARFIDSEKIIFKFDNVQLYQQDFYKYIDSIVENMGLRFHYISHLDIAVDSIRHEVIKFIHKYLERTRLNREYSIRHKGKVNRRSITTKGDNEIWWGNINSDKYIKIYNKLEELDNPNNPKNYIPVCWKQNGMITENEQVERFELTLKQPHSKLLDYKKLCDSDYLASIMETHCKNFFEFEKTITNHNKKHKRDVTPINFSGFNTVLLPKFKYVPQNTLQTEKITLKQLYFQYLQARLIASDQYVLIGITSVPERLKNYAEIKGTIDSMLYKYPTLESYYNEKRSIWEKEFNTNHELKNGKLKIEDYIKSIALSHELVSNIIEEQIYETTDGVKLRSYKKCDLLTADLVRACKNAELKQLATKSKMIEKISKPITQKINYYERLNYMNRHIIKEN